MIGQKYHKRITKEEQVKKGVPVRRDRAHPYYKYRYSDYLRNHFNSGRITSDTLRDAIKHCSAVP